MLSLLSSIGLLATVAALTLGLRATTRGDKWQSQMMMRYEEDRVFIFLFFLFLFRARIGYVLWSWLSFYENALRYQNESCIHD